MNTSDIQQGELWEIAKHLVSLNTVSSVSNKAAAVYLTQYLEDIGFSVRVVTDMMQGVEKSSVIACAGPEVEGGLIISGHSDIVPFEGQPGWRSNPLEMHIEGQHIVGRGVTDMKVFLAQALLAAKNKGIHQLKRPLVFILTCDEEIASQGSGRLAKVLPGMFSDYPLPRVALIGEPTSFSLFPANKGYVTFDIEVRGRGGHSSALDGGLNAIDRMADVIHVIKQMDAELKAHVTPENARLFPANPYTAFNNGMIQGGLAPNMIAESCNLTTSIRVAPGAPIEEILDTLQKRIDSEISQPMSTIFDQYGVIFRNSFITPPLNSPIDDPFCRFLSRVTEKHVELGAPYATDGGQFQTIGIDSYIYGPGILEQAHQPNESMPIENFMFGLEKLEQIIQGWCIEQRD